MSECYVSLLAINIALVVAVSAAASSSDHGQEQPVFAKADVGFASGPAARLSEQDLARIESLPLQDLLNRDTGRYTQVRDDGVSGYWGLDAIRSRQDAADKPYAILQRGRFLQTERVVFADLGTGATLMKLTDEPYGTGDELNYFGKSCFNADGSLMTWQRSRQPTIWGPSGQTTTATHGPMLVSADGTHLRIVQGGWPARMRPLVVCHPLNPELAYAMSGDQLLELDLRAEQVRRVVAAGMPSWWLKLSPDGKYACNDDYGRGPITVVSLETGETWTMKLSGRIHDSYRFVPGNTDWVMYWYESDPGHRGFHMMNFKTGEDRASGFTYDWNHGDMGRWIGVHESGRLYAFDGQAWQRDGNAWWPEQTFSDEGAFYNLPADYNGYCQYWPDDQLWAYGTLITERPYLSEVCAWFAKPLSSGRADRFRICYTNLRRNTDRKGEETLTLDRPNISPDGTKLLFNSNVFGTAEVYLVVLRNPLPPTNVAAHWTAGPGQAAAARLTWRPPDHHREIAGYLVYRSDHSGAGFEPLFEQPISVTEFTDLSAAPGRPCFYAVRSVEHSRLESLLSAEAAVASNAELLAKAPVRIFVEAEEAIPSGLEAPSPDAMWVSFEGMASNLYYIWQRRPDRAGEVNLPVTVPRADDYYVFARMKGRDGAEFTVAGQELALPASPGQAGTRWTWIRSPRPVHLQAGAQQLALSSSRYGSCFDCLYLSTDRGFEPKGRIRAVVPSSPTLGVAPVGEAAGGKVRLVWSREKSPRWSHYNLYSSHSPDFACDRTTLIASPDEPEHLDWGAPAGRNCYRVTQVTLDGMESPPSNVVVVEQ